MTRTELYRLFNRFKALCQLSGTPGSINKPFAAANNHRRRHA